MTETTALARRSRGRFTVRTWIVVAILVTTISTAGAAPVLRVSATVSTGRHAAGVAIVAGSVWVANDVDNSVVRIDPATASVLATTSLGGPEGKGLNVEYPDASIAAVGDGSLWVIAPTTGDVSRIDPQTGKLVARIKVHARALGITFTAGKAWVTGFDRSRVTQIDTRTNKITGAFTIPWPTSIAYGYRSLWIVDHRIWSVTRVDPSSRKVVARIPVRVGQESPFEGPENVVVGLGGVWVSQPSQDVLTRIDARTNKIVARIRFPRNSTPFQLALGHDALWVLGPKRIFRVNPNTNRIDASALIGTHPGSDYRGLRGIAVRDHSLWITDADADTADRIDLP